ncbi:MAG: sulfotransferase [Chloroflexota bacterium]
MYFILFAIIILWVVYVYLKIRVNDQAYLEMNERDWHIHLLPSPSLFVRLFNVMVGRTGATILVTLLEKTAIRSALNKSLKQMVEAEASGNVPSVLCDAEAQATMRTRLARQADDIRASTTMTPFAKVSTYAGSLLHLANHTGLLKLGMAAHAEQVREPVFIVSMPRTGTTILHRTMATDTSRFRTFDMADMVQPLPPLPRSDRLARNTLAKKAQKVLVDPLKKLFPGWVECLETMHAMVPDQVDEDIGWYDSGLGMGFVESQMFLYREHKRRDFPLQDRDLATYRYAWLDMVMRIYQTLEPESNKPWLMKDPFHTAFLPQLLQQFPDAKLIFMHRPPEDVLASMAKLFLCFTCIGIIPGAKGTESAVWGQNVLDKVTLFLAGIVEFSKSTQMDKNRRIDFQFSIFAPNIITSIEQIYEAFFNQRPSEAAISVMQSYLDDHDREKKGNQPRSLADFHLTRADVAFEEYRDTFL